MFGRALDAFPDHARSLLGVAAACHRDGPHRGTQTRPLEHATRAVGELLTGPPSGGSGDGRRDAATSSCARPLEATSRARAAGRRPPGFAGWTIPIEPFFAPLGSDAAFHAC